MSKTGLHGVISSLAFRSLPQLSDDFFVFLVFDNFFQKLTPFIQNLLPFLCIFLSLSLFFLSFVFFKLKKNKNSRLIIGGGQKRGFGPPSYLLGGACPGWPPESTPMFGA